MPEYVETSIPSNAGVASYPPGATYGPRQMRDWEFVWLLQGDAEYTWGEATILAPEGSFVLCRPGETDFFRWDRAKRTRHAYVHFQMKPDGQSLLLWPLVREPLPDDILPALFKHLLTCLEGGDSIQAQQTLQLMVTTFGSGHRAMGSVSHRSWPLVVEQVCAFIFARLDENPAIAFTLAELAGIGCVSPEHLCRLFQSSVGHSPMKMVRLVRLEHAAILLERSNYSVGEVAALTGFVSLYHFSRAMKVAFGQSPSELRRRMRETGLPPAPSFAGVKSIQDK